VYPSTGCAGGDEGDLVMIGPPLTIDDEESEMLVSRLTAALGHLE
jgi:4-aminobutyrate aminotransferase-like enzyme